jgi:NADH dehydrogenase (ubiquinone) Fe-S protein 3
MALERDVSSAEYLLAVVPNSMFRIQCRDEYYIYSYSHQHALYKVCLSISKHYNIRAKLFVDLVASDFLHNRSRFVLSYNILSTAYNVRILPSFVVQNTATLRSLVKQFPSINWYEREVYDMFGISSIDHQDMRRILTDYGF